MQTRDRALRRHLAKTYSRKRQKAHRSLVHPDSQLDCACEGAPFYFSKRRAVGCPCRKKRFGAPRRSIGCCKIDSRDHIYAQRRTKREILGAILSGRYHPEEDLVSRSL